MGPWLSAKVLTDRTQGPFKDWADLMQRVSGIRTNKAQQLSAQGLTVNAQPLSQSRNSVFTPKRRSGKEAFPHTAIATTSTTGGGLGRRWS